MSVAILAEKSSAAASIAKALGAGKDYKGTYGGTDYVITYASGHLYELDGNNPAKQVAHKGTDVSEAVRVWGMANLPWNLEDFAWSYTPGYGKAEGIGRVSAVLPFADEIVIATDLDPTGEGGLIAVSVIKALGLAGKKISRMYFTDEASPSLQKGFTERVVIPDLDEFGEYKMASFRNRWDFASMQWTRVASLVARNAGLDLMVRQGRLKSVMVRLVGDQLKLIEDYVRKPVYQARFRDENKVMYTDPDQATYATEAQVPMPFTTSAVVCDSKTAKSTAPPRLLDLAAVSGQLARKGMNAKDVLETYQRMYEDQVLSYPRTEDKTITPEQFNDLLPLADEIAAVVGVDTGLLSHRAPRGTHVVAQGAHGANRPGLKVPASMAQVRSRYGVIGEALYDMLARNYLAMLADDYRYERQKGHIADYPSFVGTADVPLSPGWKAVFDTDAGNDAGNDDADAGDQDSAKGLGTIGEPFVFELVNKKPVTPNMTWLMAQLEKYDVGTGATRAKTYAELTEPVSDRNKYPLLVEAKNKLSLAQAGKASWLLLPGTHIGDLHLTETVLGQMRDVASGKADADGLLAEIAQLVRDDIEVMRANGAQLLAEMGSPAAVAAAAAGGEGLYLEAVWQTAPGGPRKVKFKRVWGQHAFTDDEIHTLLTGGKISFTAVGSDGNQFPVTGCFGIGEMPNGRKFTGFQRDMNKPGIENGWCQVVFTAAEQDVLRAGGSVSRDDFVGKKGPFSCSVRWDGQAKKFIADFGNDDVPRKVWCSYQFSDAEYKALCDGEQIGPLNGFVGKKGPFSAKVSWDSEAKRMVAEFVHS